MRNLKKVLSLALAFVMLMGLMIVGAGAAVTTTKDYTDGANVNYAEAVDVMSAIGVFNGANGTFAPQGDLTRAQAAKIITYMLLGKEAAEKLGTLTAPYTDVAASYWAAGSIAYCTNMGIVSGIGNGQFGPDAQVTGYQFAKMLLVALGYDSERENLTGRDWAINVSRLAITSSLDLGVDNGTDIALDKPLTREEACQMAFNAMKATMVEYATNASTITVGGTPIVIGGSNATKVTSTRDYARNFGDAAISVAGTSTYTLEFGERYFQTLRKVVSSDDMGRPAHTWQYGREDVGTYADSAVFTYTNDCTSGGNKDALVKALSGYSFTSLKEIEVLYNGKAEGASDTAGSSAINSAADLAAKTGNGILVEVYADLNRVVNRVVVIETELMQVSRINTSNKTVTLKSVAGTISNSQIANVPEDNSNYAALSAMAVNDYVLVVPTWNTTNGNYDVASISVPNTATGRITAVTTSGSKTLTIGGQAYSFAKIADASVTGAAPNTTKDYTLWVDAYGYAVYTDAVASSVRNIAFVYDTYQTLSGNRIVNMANVVWTTGETASIQYSNDYNSIIAGKAYNYSLNGSVYDLDAVATAGVAGSLTTAAANKFITLKNTGSIKASERRLSSTTQADSTNYFNNFYANDVVFIYYNAAGNTVSVKNGVQAVANIPNNSIAIVEENTSKDNTAVISAVVIFGSASYVDSNTLVYISDTTSTGRVTLNNTSTNSQEIVPTYDGYIDGKKETITTASSPLTPKTFYSYAVNESNGAWQLVAYTASEGTAVAPDTTASSAFGNTVMTITGNIELDISSAVVTDLRSGPVKTASPINENAAGVCDAIRTYGSVNVSVIYDSATGKASHVYVEDTGNGYTVTTADNSVAKVCLTEDGTYGDSVTAPAGTAIYVKLMGTTNVTKSGLTLVTGTAGQADAIYRYTVTGNETLDVAEHTHSLTYVKTEAVSATCAADGNIEYYTATCSVAGCALTGTKYAAQGTETAVTGSALTGAEIVTNATGAHNYADEDASNHKCSVCGKTEAHDTNGSNGVCSVCGHQ